MAIFPWSTPSVHQLADDLTEELYEARPSSKMLDAFRREGRRDGRRGREVGPVREYLVDAADLAASRIVREYLEAKSSIAQRRAAAERIVAGSASMSVRPDDPQPNATGHGAAAGDLDSALGALAARRAKRHVDERRERHAQERAEAERASAEAAAVAAESDLLEERFAQRVTSTQEAASMFMDRYLAGYAQGLSRRGHEDGDELPDVRLDLEMPELLRHAVRGVA